MKHTAQAGFTAIELVLVLSVLGVVMAGVFSQLQPVDQQTRVAVTKTQMERIVDAIGAFVLKNNRLPCPAYPGDPAPDLRGEEPAVICDDPEEVEGIVPYRTLGLPEDLARDAWGHYVTYRVSPVFANPDFTPGATLHARCREQDGFAPEWIVTVPPNTNVNPDKARFCCASGNVVYAPDTDIIINDMFGNPVFDPRTAADYGLDNVAVAGPPVADTEAVAFVLISHGANAHGAFVVDTYMGTPQRLDFTAEAGDDEVENAQLDLSACAGLNDAGCNTYVDTRSLDRDGSDHFDDILIWRSQDDIYAELTGARCAAPER